jgi:hypothetical protein
MEGITKPQTARHRARRGASHSPLRRAPPSGRGHEHQGWAAAIAGGDVSRMEGARH